METQFAKAPATRWDRLVAVLEDVDPERVIDALHIIERAKRQGVTDLELFYILGIRYQSKNSMALTSVLNLYILMSTWVEWLKAVDVCFRAKRLGNSSNAPSSSSADQSTHNLLCPSRVLSRLASEQLDSFLGTGEIMSPSVRPTAGAVQSLDNSQRALAMGFSGTPKSQNDNSQFRNPSIPLGKVAVKLNTREHGAVFDLGGSWVWEGTLDFLRDGVLLSKLVQEL